MLSVYEGLLDMIALIIALLSGTPSLASRDTFYPPLNHTTFITNASLGTYGGIYNAPADATSPIGDVYNYCSMPHPTKIHTPCRLPSPTIPLPLAWSILSISSVISGALLITSFPGARTKTTTATMSIPISTLRQLLRGPFQRKSTVKRTPTHLTRS